MSEMQDTNTRAADENLTPAQKLKAAEKLCADLNTALRATGVKLPSLCVDALGYADTNPTPLIRLGGCNLDTARALLAVLRTTQEHPAPTTA